MAGMVPVLMRSLTIFILAAALFMTASVLVAWTGPTQTPPNGNVNPPVNVGDTDQVKNAGLSVNALAVFGNMIMNGASRYLNFGTTVGSAGYGIRDNAGTMQFRNSSGTWSNFLPSTGIPSITFADGTTQTTAASGGGSLSCTTRTASIGNSWTPATVNCAAGETMTGGGYYATAQGASCQYNNPQGNGWRAGSCVSCITTGCTRTGGTVYVRCCSVQ